MTATTGYLLYLVFALGGSAVYLLLPKADRRQNLSGIVVGLLALVALLTVLATRVISPSPTSGYFYLFSTIALVGAVRVITHPKPVYCAMYFIVVVLAVAALFVLLHAEFLAVASIIIYTGAILVTYLFVIMLAQQGGSPVYDRRSREPFLAVLAGFVLMAAIAGQVGERRENLPDATPAARLTGQVTLSTVADYDSNTMAIGATVMTKHVVALEIAGILLLVSMIGAIALSRKKLPVEGVTAPRKSLGQVGREAEPY